MKKELLGSSDNLEDLTELPGKGLGEKALLAKTKEYLDMGEFDWTSGTQSGTVYNGNPELTKVMTEVYGMAAWTNPLHPDTFPGIKNRRKNKIEKWKKMFNYDIELRLRS